MQLCMVLQAMHGTLSGVAVCCRPSLHLLGCVLPCESRTQMKLSAPFSHQSAALLQAKKICLWMGVDTSLLPICTTSSV